MIVLELIVGLAMGVFLAYLIFIWPYRGARAVGRAARNTVVKAAYGQEAADELIAKQRKPTAAEDLARRRAMLEDFKAQRAARKDERTR